MDLKGDGEWLTDDQKKEIKQRNHPGPISRVIYDLLVRSLQRQVRRRAFDLSPWPSEPELKAAGFLKPKGGHSRREKFRSWAERMELASDPDTGVDVLRHKRTGKLIVPIEDFESVIRQMHTEADHDARSTTKLIQDKYTIGNREFGIDKHIITYMMGTCTECLKRNHFDSKDDGNAKLHVNGAGLSNQPLTPVPPIQSCSMVANVPSSKCIWFDKDVIASNSDFYSRLRDLLNEVRGELGRTSQGSKEAKDRLLTKIYIAESLIRDYRSTLSGDSLRISEYNEQFIADVKALLQSYRSQGRQALFVPDMKLLVDAYRTAGFSDLFIQSFEALTRSLVANGR